MFSLGDIMKKTIITILCAFLLGGTLSLFTVYKLKDSFLNPEKNQNTVTAFQIGVYKSLDNAKLTMNKYPGSISLKDGEYYRVYLSVAVSKERETSLETFYNTQNITVYPKNLQVTKTFYEELSKLETVLEKTEEDVAQKLNAEIMKKLEGEVL